MKKLSLLLIPIIILSILLSISPSHEKKSVYSENYVEIKQMSESKNSSVFLNQYIENMTLEEKVGQMFLVRCYENRALKDIEKYHLGGFVLFAVDFEGESKSSFIDKIESYQENSKIPMLISVDEEGGIVTRVSSYKAFRSKKFDSIRNLYKEGGIDTVLKEETEKNELLISLGINVNLAPVVDITTNKNAFMYSRSLGLSPDKTGEVIQEIVGNMEEHSVGSVMKHFPGYGNNTDTHVAMAIDSRSLETLENNDLIPFKYGIEAGADAILVSHTIVRELDSKNPVSLSSKAIRYLREEMNFNGVIITDDLCMQAISDHYGVKEASVLAALAGNDLLLSTDYQVQYQAVLDAVKDGTIPMDQINKSVYRILRWKQELGLI